MAFDFTQISKPTNDTPPQLFDYSKLRLNVEADRYNEIAQNPEGIVGSLNFMRNNLIPVFQNKHFALLDVFKQHLEETHHNQEEIDKVLTDVTVALDSAYDNAYSIWDRLFKPVVAYNDSQVKNDNVDLRCSQVVGIGAYAAINLFVDCLLGLTHQYQSHYGLIDDRFKKNVIDKGLPTKSLLITHAPDIIDCTLCSIFDYGKDNAKQLLRQELCDLALDRFDSALQYRYQEMGFKETLKELDALEDSPLEQEG